MNSLEQLSTKVGKKKENPVQKEKKEEEEDEDEDEMPPLVDLEEHEDEIPPLFDSEDEIPPLFDSEDEDLVDSEEHEDEIPPLIRPINSVLWRPSIMHNMYIYMLEGGRGCLEQLEILPPVDSEEDEDEIGEEKHIAPCDEFAHIDFAHTDNRVYDVVVVPTLILGSSFVGITTLGEEDTYEGRGGEKDKLNTIT